MSDKSNLGTIVDGIGASEHLDSSGEVLDIKGMDISSLGSADSILNFEHGSKENPAQVCGKVTFAKKIFKKSDCDNARQEYFWDICKKPFVYVKGELFDHPSLDHDGARNVAALLRYDNRDKGQKTRRLISFSIEGGKMDKKGMVVKKSIARDLALTIKHCNKMCIAEILDDIKDRRDLYKGEEPRTSRNIIIEEMKKSLPSKQDFNASVDRFKDTKSFKQKQNISQNITDAAAKPIMKPAGSEPKREFIQKTTPSTLKVGDRIKYDKPKMKTGKDIYNNPNTWKSENNMRKALVAGMMNVAPSTLTGGAALASEELLGQKKDVTKKKEKNLNKAELKKMSQPTMSFPKMGVENKPDMNVKRIDPNKKFKDKSGKEFTQTDIERKKIENKYVQGQKQQAGAEKIGDFDKKSINYINKQKKAYGEALDPSTTRGVNVASYNFGINDAYDYSKGQSKDKMAQTKGRGNYPSTKHHEGLHQTLTGVAQKTSSDHSKNLVRHILDNFFDKNNVKGVSDYVGQNYDKNDPHLREEHLTHILDLLTNRDKRNDHNQHFVNGKVGDIDYKQLKQGWKKAVKFAKNLDAKTLNKINDFYNKKDKESKNKKVVVEKIPPGGYK